MAQNLNSHLPKAKAHALLITHFCFSWHLEANMCCLDGPMGTRVRFSETFSIRTAGIGKWLTLWEPFLPFKRRTILLQLEYQLSCYLLRLSGASRIQMRQRGAGLCPLEIPFRIPLRVHGPPSLKPADFYRGDYKILKWHKNKLLVKEMRTPHIESSLKLLEKGTEKSAEYNLIFVIVRQR